MRRRVAGAATLSAAALFEGAWWPQLRRWARGKSASCRCTACGEAVGSLWHRLGKCPAGDAARADPDSGCPEWLRRRGAAAVWDPLFSRGVPARPKLPPPPPEVERWAGSQPRDGAVATGDVYTDGAARGLVPRALRAGWSVVVLGTDGQVAWALYGSCGELVTSVVRAELRGLLEALRRAVTPIRVHVDNAEVVDGVRKGRAWCCSATRDGADLWRQVWAILDDLGPEAQVVKVKAHTTPEDVDEGRIAPRDRAGNEFADRYAKLGSKLAEHLSPTAAVDREYLKAVRWAQWVVRFSSNWLDDAADDEEGGDHGDDDHMDGNPSSRRAPKRTRAGGMRHLTWQFPTGRHTCRRCGRNARSRRAQQLLAASPCLGAAAGRALAWAGKAEDALLKRCLHSRERFLGRGGTPVEGVEDPVDHEDELEHV